MGRLLRVLHLGRRGYAEVEALQEALRVRVLAGDASAETLLFVEHDPVVTLGRRTQDGLRFSERDLTTRGIAVHRVSRGGEATYHGPGQLVVYPILRLERGVVAHVEALARAAVTVAAAAGVLARYDRDPLGVWVGARKLASIGIHVHRRVAMHGLALNVRRLALDGFSAIVPCGLPDVEMTSIESEGGVVRADVDLHFARAFAEQIDRVADAHASS